MGRHSGLDLLPSNKTGWETAMSLASAERDIDTSALIAAFDPATCPARLLPWLASVFSVDFWRDTWPEAKKRSVIARSIDLHRRKGTLSAIKDFIEIADASLVSAVVPPQEFYLSPGPAEDPAWRAWINGLPEIRVYQVRSPSVTAVGVLCDAGDENMPEICFLGAEEEEAEETFFAADVLLPTEVEYAVMIDGGATKPIGMNRRADTRVGQFGTVVDFWLPGVAGLGAFADGEGWVDGIDYLDGSPELPQALSVAFGPPVVPGEGWALADEHARWVQDIQPEAGAYEVVSPIGLIASEDFADDAILDEADEGSGTYQAIRLIRPGLSMPPAANFWDDGRLAIEPYTAELVVRIPETSGPGIAHVGVDFLDATHSAPEPDLRALFDVCEAVATAKSVRDRVFLDLDAPAPRRSLMAARRLSELQLG